MDDTIINIEPLCDSLPDETHKKSSGGTARGNCNILWTEKYRPKTLDDVSGHPQIIQSIKSLLGDGKSPPHMLFYGPPGTGKTSTILACIRDYYGEHYNRYVLELNASSDRGIETMRTKIPLFCRTNVNTDDIILPTTAAAEQKIKIVVLDEAEYITLDAQGALRRIMEIESHRARFCIITNYITKILPAIRSRCVQFFFPLLSVQGMRGRLKYICDCERIDISEDDVGRLSQIGDLRSAINTLQTLSELGDEDDGGRIHITREMIDTQLQQIDENFVHRIYDTCCSGQFSPTDLANSVYKSFHTKTPSTGQKLAKVLHTYVTDRFVSESKKYEKSGPEGIAQRGIIFEKYFQMTKILYEVYTTQCKDDIFPIYYIVSAICKYHF